MKHSKKSSAHYYYKDRFTNTKESEKIVFKLKISLLRLKEKLPLLENIEESLHGKCDQNCKTLEK